MSSWIREKMAIQELAPRGGKFFACGLTATGNGAFAYNDPCVLHGDCSTIVGNGSRDNAHTSNPSNRGERLGGELSTLLQRT
jgi:hypothetical protein